MTKLLLTVSLLLTALACDGSGDLTSEADASPDSLTQVRADGGVIQNTDVLVVKPDTIATRPTSCPAPTTPKVGYIFTTGKVVCDATYLKEHPGYTCEEFLESGSICCVSVYGKSPSDPTLYDLATWKMLDGRQVSSSTMESTAICSPLVARLPGETAVCSTEGKFIGWTCL